MKKLRTLKTLNFLLPPLPLIAIIIYNFKDYFMAEEQTFLPQWLNLSLGGMIAVVAVVSLMLGKTDKVNPLTVSFIIFILTIFLQSLLVDIQIITFAIFLGLLIRKCFEGPIERATEVNKYRKQAEAQAEAMKPIMNGRG
mgnify:FL=1